MTDFTAEQEELLTSGRVLHKRLTSLERVARTRVAHAEFQSAVQTAASALERGIQSLSKDLGVSELDLPSGSARIALRMLETACATEAGELPELPTAAAEELEPQPQLTGHTSVLAIADLLELLGAQNKTGILRVEGGSESFSVHLKHGKVIHASSDRAPQGERLGDILVRLGYISQGHLDAFLRGFMGSGRKLGEVLEKGSVVTTEQLAEALAEQVRLMFYRLFSLRDGRFSFRPEDVDDGAFQRVDLGLRWLLFESARQVDEARETAGPA